MVPASELFLSFGKLGLVQLGPNSWDSLLPQNQLSDVIVASEPVVWCDSFNSGLQQAREAESAIIA